MAQNETATGPYRQAPPRNYRRPVWTIMIYLAGDNNLSANSVDIMRELEAGFPNLHHPDRDIRVVACFDSNTPRPKGSRYVEINFRRHQGANPIPDWGLHNDTVPEGDCGDHSVTAPDFCNKNPSTIHIPAEPIAEEGLDRFLKYTRDHHDADGFMLILFGHGSAVAGNTFLLDNNPPSFLRLENFAKVLSKHFSVSGEGGKPALDILACDNCMMNGIESAFQVRKSVKYMIGSQGLMLAVGWQFRRILRRIIGLRCKTAREVADAVCEVCARGLLDFALMDRSSDQSLLDVTTLRRRGGNLVTAVKQLSCTLQDALATDEDTGQVLYPTIRDAVLLARLEAQSYFDEAFVDLYDFCHLLLKKCNAAVREPIKMVKDALRHCKDLPAILAAAPKPIKKILSDEREMKRFLLCSEVMKKFKRIAEDCVRVLNEIKVVAPAKDEHKQEHAFSLTGKFVLISYYIGPDLQYSNGVSIYFPWTLPDTPIIFDPVDGTAAAFRRPPQQPREFLLKTPFDEYESYEFAKPDGGDWSAFLKAFFRATLRDVRRLDFWYREDTTGQGLVEIGETLSRPFRKFESEFAGDADLHKSSSDVDSETASISPRIKNYPRRFYISPADCLRRCPIPVKGQRVEGSRGRGHDQPCVSYLGWNIRGLVAHQVGLPEERRFSLPPFGAAAAPSDASPAGASGTEAAEEK